MTEQGLLDILAGLGEAQAESAKAHAKTETLFAALSEANAAAQIKADFETAELKKVVAETSRRVDETSRKLTEVGIRLGSMGQNLGDVAETFFYNSLVAAPEIGGISFDRVEIGRASCRERV